MKATLKFASRPAAQAFATRWVHKTLRGYSLSPARADGSAEVALDGITPAEKEWIDAEVSAAPVTPENPEQEQQSGEAALTAARAMLTTEAAPLAMPPAVAFFYNEAGFSYDPLTQTPAEGRLETAKALAKAESMASEAGCSFEWELDGGDSREWDAEGPVTPTWVCTMRSPSGTVLESVSGVDFGDSEPWGQPYRRVVEAELAFEATYRRNAIELATA